MGAAFSHRGGQFAALGSRRVFRGLFWVWYERYALLTVLIAAFGRSISEVVAVMIVGGNIEGFTRVMTTSIALETSKGDLPLALALGMEIVIGLYLLANLTYLVVRPFDKVKTASLDRGVRAIVGAVFPSAGAKIMAIAIMISTFGCINGMVLAGARACFAMAEDTGCATFKWPVTREQALFPAAPAAQSGVALTVGQAVDFTLAAVDTISFAVSPERRQRAHSARRRA